MDSPPFVSIIVLNFNGRQWLKECFESLEKLNYPKDRFEILMGDNASTDDSVEYVQKNFPCVKVIRFDRNYGFCKSNNLCARQRKGDYLVFLNNDTFVQSDWLAHLVEGALSEPNVISCASKILFPHLGDGNVINAAGGVIFPTGCGMYEGWMDLDSVKYNVQKVTGFGCGAGVLIDRKFFIDTGGFDEYYFYSGEEMDLGFRVWLSGSKVLYVPSAVMYHYMGRTGFRGKGTTPTIEFLITRNNLYFILKNFEWFTAIKGLVLFVFRVASKILYALFHLNVHIPIAIAKAHLAILKDLGKIFKVRGRAQRMRKVRDRELYRSGIIVGATEVFRRTYAAAQNTKKYQEGSMYDTKDSVKIKIDEHGEFTFYEAES